MESPNDRLPELTVFYDGSCPLCSAEITLYQRKAAPGKIEFCDVSDQNAALPLSLSRPDALARFHVQTKTGQLISGAAGFVKLWEHLPGWRWLAKVAYLPGFTPMLEVTYRVFLNVRPGLVWLFCRCFGRVQSG
jgi:predicted DCC family thiol-disulfide oxidoreductase YuxK